MCLFDTLDGCFMNFAYGWAFSRPIRKVYYNIIITGLSVQWRSSSGPSSSWDSSPPSSSCVAAFWDTMANFNINRAGFIIVGMFVATWAVALAVWRFGHIETRWDRSATLTRAEAVATVRLERGIEGVDPFEPAWAEAD